MDDEGWTLAVKEDVAQSIAYVLRGLDTFPASRRSRAKLPFNPDVLADRIVDHLRLANFRVLKGPPAKGHSTTGPGSRKVSF